MIKDLKEKKKICIVIPAYNEASVIGDVVKSVREIFSKNKKYELEIVIVNDSSKDDTAQVAEKNGATVINHIINSGAGGATATGLRYAEKNNFQIAATMDADGQHLPEDVLRGFDLITKNKKDLLIGSRLVNSEGMSKIKVIGNRGLSFVTYLLFGIYSTDSQSGLRIYSSKALRDLRWKTSGYEFCSEMLWRAKQLELRVGEYPIKAIYTDYSRSKGQSNWNAINIIKSLLKRRVEELLG